MHVFLTGPGHEHRGYKTSADRRRAVKLLRRRGLDVLSYRDTQAEFAVMITYSKSYIMMRQAKKEGMKVVHLFLKTLTADDLCGIPVVK